MQHDVVDTSFSPKGNIVDIDIVFSTVGLMRALRSFAGCRSAGSRNSETPTVESPTCRVVEVDSGGSNACDENATGVGSRRNGSDDSVENRSNAGVEGRSNAGVEDRSNADEIFFAFQFFDAAVFACLLKVSRIHTSVHTRSIVGVPLKECI